MLAIQSRLHRLVVAELGIAPERVLPSLRLAELGDSLDWVNLLDAVEVEFSLSIGDDDVARLRTLHDLAAWIDSREQVTHAAA